MMLQKWASKPCLIAPTPRQHENGPTRQSGQDRSSSEPVVDVIRNEPTPPQGKNEPTPPQDILQTIIGAPLEIQSLVAQHLSNSDVASLSSVYRNSHEAFWNSEGVWLAFAARDYLPLCRSGVAKFTRDAYRRAAYRLDCGDLEALASAPQAGADPSLFNEALHVIKGLMPDDAHEIQLLCKVMGPALESLNFIAAGAAEAFLSRAHERTDLLSSKDLQMLDGAYDYALFQHNLMMDTIEEHLEDLETQMRSVEQQVCEDHRSLIMDQ